MTSGHFFCLSQHLEFLQYLKIFRLKNSPEQRPPLPSNSPLILAREAVVSQVPTAPGEYILDEWMTFILHPFQQNFSHIGQGCHGQGKISGNEFFPGQGKVREFCGWPENFRKDLESQAKVREFENKWLWQAVFRKFIYSVQEGKGYTFSSDSLSTSPSSLGATLKGKNLLPWGANSFL